MSYDLQKQLDGGHLLFWHRVMRVQCDRALDREKGDEVAEVDINLYAITLRHVLRAIDLCRDYAPDIVDNGLKALAQKVPHIVEIRNIIEHFDEYERGVGRLQKTGAVGEIIDWYEFDGTTYRLQISGKYTLDVKASMEAASSLVGEILAVMFPS